MSKSFYKIEPDISDNRVACIEDWGFTYWPNKPKSEIIKNPDGTFSVIMEKEFVPLVDQLCNLFKDDNAPESVTYLGEALLGGKNEPMDCIYGNFINGEQGLVISNRLLEILKKFELPEHFIYELPLIKKRKTYNDFSYIYFKQMKNELDYDVRLIMDKYTLFVCVSEKLKEAICNSEIKGCKFTQMN